jgi:hypothetical protein
VSRSLLVLYILKNSILYSTAYFCKRNIDNTIFYGYNGSAHRTTCFSETGVFAKFCVTTRPWLNWIEQRTTDPQIRRSNRLGRMRILLAFVV